MNVLAGVLTLAWLALTLLWLFTFIGPTRRTLARALLAPWRIPLRRARWGLTLSALTLFVLTGVVAPPTDLEKSAPSATATTPSASVSEGASPASSGTPPVAQASTTLPEGSVIVPRGKWTIMSFATTGSEAEHNVGLDETRREVFGFAEDSTYDSKSDCEQGLRKVQELPSEVELLKQYHSQEDQTKYLAEARIVERRSMSAVCEQSDGSSRFAASPLPLLPSASFPRS